MAAPSEYLGALLVVMPGVAEHELHVLNHGLLRRVLVIAYVVLDHLQVHWLQDDFVIVWIVLFGWLNHEQITEPPACAGLSSFQNRVVQDLHPLLSYVLLTARLTTTQRGRMNVRVLIPPSNSMSYLSQNNFVNSSVQSKDIKDVVERIV